MKLRVKKCDTRKKEGEKKAKENQDGGGRKINLLDTSQSFFPSFTWYKQKGNTNDKEVSKLHIPSVACNCYQRLSLARTWSDTGALLPQIKKNNNKFKKNSSSSSTSLALPTKAERARKIPVTSNAPSEPQIRKSSQKCHLPNQRHTAANHEAHQNPENIHCMNKP